jgi:hypothetical protein
MANRVQNGDGVWVEEEDDDEDEERFRRKGLTENRAVSCA